MIGNHRTEVLTTIVSPTPLILLQSKLLTRQYNPKLIKASKQSKLAVIYSQIKSKLITHLSLYHIYVYNQS